MRAVFPHPILSLGLFAASLLMSASVAPPSLALAALAAVLAPQVMRVLSVDRVRIRSPKAVLQLATVVAVDVIRSNWEVAWVILGRRRHERKAGFIHIPLQMRDRHGLAVLAIIITSTPGTLWVEYEAATGQLLLHVLDLVDEDEWIELIKTRYERRLMEIFE
ncbi:Na+/H+ antiporter subunit E [Brevundimonas nasdae]|uniref:Na+/H+ antiporter subunit E n=1 Tax=Brevundimonas nasdae TaxID=172043 RepID=A0ABX8THL8_9CAUL|nr:Na+/H+ antiporter subunit E [Brevundimonas nasdae]QYC10731.1 Na+/H+ antiporter subunit E [Brevundimonas nasdae]QYC13518.1 Na+/H+ antiporter subunit E [Brevundimonas nasdae]